MTLLAAALALVMQGPVVEGVVASSDGGPIPYAQVMVVDDSMATWTDEEGRYRLELERGRWRVRVVHPGHDSLDVQLRVPGDRTFRVDVTLQARPGPVVDALSDFEPFQVEYTLPSLANDEEVARLIQERYPRDLARDGVGGETVLRLWLDERGQVVRGVLSRSSGEARLDALALELSARMHFRPAKNREDAVRVIVRIPVLFTVPDSVREALAEG